MRRYFAFFAGAALITAVLSGGFLSCNRSAETSGERVFENYTAWKKLNPDELNYPIPGHESNYRIVYINEKGETPHITKRGDVNTYSFPEGTIIVKEVYRGLEIEEGEKPFQLTVMIKAPHNQQARGGWLWIVKDMESGEETIFSHEFCITCHANANEQHPYDDGNSKEEFRDYVFFAPYAGNQDEE